MQALDPIWLPVAFALGLAARLVGLPPLVGFLAGGFVLHAMGLRTSELVEGLADIGVTLLLFTIGLKLRVHQLLRPEIWAGTTLQMGITSALFTGLFALLAVFGVARFAALDGLQWLLLGFAFAFSSTVFAVKVLEERGEAASRHGGTAIGMLIMQDVIAVVFIAASTGELPSPWALGLILLFVLRPLLYAILERAGHGELLILLGFLFALGLGYAGFEALGVKGDLGALAVGMLLAPHPKAKELAATLLGFKDLLLVGFFLSIGLRGLPDPSGLLVALVMVAFLPLKVAVYFGLLTRFRLRARTSLLASLALANYSEFGLIVAAISVKVGWLDPEWLVIAAIALSVSLVAAAPLNSRAHEIYEAWCGRIRRFESKQRVPGDEAPDIGDVEIAVFGMGRVGSSIYDVLRARFGNVVGGLDSDPDAVAAQCAVGRRVVLGDAMDADFWQTSENRLRGTGRSARLVVLALSEHEANLHAAQQIRHRAPDLLIAASARFDDEIGELEGAGVDVTCSVLSQAGTGFAELIAKRLEAA